MPVRVLECSTKTALYVDILHQCRTKKYVRVHAKATDFVNAWRRRKEEARELLRNKPFAFHLHIVPTNHKIVNKWRDPTTGSKLPAAVTATVTGIRTMGIKAINHDFPGGVLTSQHYRPGARVRVRDKYNFHRENKAGVLIERPHYEIEFRLLFVRADKIESRIGRHTTYWLRSLCNECE